MAEGQITTPKDQEIIVRLIVEKMVKTSSATRSRPMRLAQDVLAVLSSSLRSASTGAGRKTNCREA